MARRIFLIAFALLAFMLGCLLNYAVQHVDPQSIYADDFRRGTLSRAIWDGMSMLMMGVGILILTLFKYISKSA